MELIPVNIRLNRLRWLVIGELRAAECFAAIFRQFDAQVDLMLTHAHPAEGQALRPPPLDGASLSVASLTRVLQEKQHDAIVCLQRGMLSPAQKQLIKDSGIAVCYHGDVENSTLLLPDNIASKEIGILLREPGLWQRLEWSVRKLFSSALISKASREKEPRVKRAG